MGSSDSLNDFEMIEVFTIARIRILDRPAPATYLDSHKNRYILKCYLSSVNTYFFLLIIPANETSGSVQCS